MERFDSDSGQFHGVEPDHPGAKHCGRYHGRRKRRFVEEKITVDVKGEILESKHCQYDGWTNLIRLHPK